MQVILYWMHLVNNPLTSALEGGSTPKDCVISTEHMFKNKLYDIFFWVFYNWLWWVIAFGNPVKASVAIFTTADFIKYAFFTVLPMLAIWFNLFVLVPRYLEKGRNSAYTFSLLGVTILTSVLIVPCYYLTAAAMGKPVSEVFKTPKEDCLVSFFTVAVSAMVTDMGMGMSIKFAQDWLNTRKRQQVLEKEKLETELQFLKNQFNPHFLFNSINSIFFLIHKNPDMASASLAKFSALLRYQLYECNDEQIPLSKEMAYLQNFIELERLRQNKNTNLHVYIDPIKESDQWGIAPFIIMTFVENAFKHVSKESDQSNWIDIQLQLAGSRLKLVVSNSLSTEPESEVIRSGGIGLNNVQRRLDLVYPEQHQLHIEKKDDRFEVRLSLELSVLGSPVLHKAQGPLLSTTI
jgi:two-component system, LytTR family, sensor kinase